MTCPGDMEATLKTCRICAEEKVSTEFHLHKANSDGLRSECKECRKTRDKRWMSVEAVRARYNEKYGIRHKVMTYAFKEGNETVSYTHLTLPTICSV